MNDENCICISIFTLMYFTFGNMNLCSINTNSHYLLFGFTIMNAENKMLLNVNSKLRRVKEVKIRHFSRNLDEGTGSLKKREF